MARVSGSLMSISESDSSEAPAPEEAEEILLLLLNQPMMIMMILTMKDNCAKAIQTEGSGVAF